MALSIANRSDGAVTASGSTFTCSVTRSAGEGLIFAFFWEYEWGAAPAITSVVWDPTGDNQAMTLVQDQISSESSKRFAVYQLKAPTSAKTADIVVTCASTSISACAFICDRVIDFDSTSWVTNSAKRTEANPATNDLQNTVTSATGELVISYGFIRNDIAYLSAGDTSDYFGRSGTSSSRCIFRGTKAGAASVSTTFDYSDVSSYANALIALSIAPASGGGGGGITGTLATTEAADIAAIAGDVIITGTIAATEAADVAAFSGGSTPVTGTLAGTEAGDTAASTGTVRNPRLVIGPLKNNTGTLLASETGATVYVYQTSGAHVVTKTSQTTDGAAIMTVSDAAMAAGTTYRFVIVLSGGAEGMDKLAAA